MRHMRSFAVALIPMVSACKTPGNPSEGSEVRQFFENATRRDPNDTEKASVVRLDGCTGYFIKNDTGKIFVGSARHCVKNTATKWCDDKGVVYTPGWSRVGTCKRVVGSRSDRDIVIFEIDRDPNFNDPIVTYRLAAYTPPKFTRLRMIGFPGDKHRNGALTVTEDCWILRAPVESPHYDGNWKDWSAKHNCSTYGGNSGGPMIKAGTSDVIGLPFTYQPNDYTNRDKDSELTAAHLALMSGFVEENRLTLKFAGIDIAEGASGLATTTTISDRPATSNTTKCVTTRDLLDSIDAKLKRLQGQTLTPLERLIILDVDLRKDTYGVCPANSGTQVEYGCVSMDELEHMTALVTADAAGAEEGTNTQSDGLQSYKKWLDKARAGGICEYPEAQGSGDKP
jgi:hypothetical protein